MHSISPFGCHLIDIAAPVCSHNQLQLMFYHEEKSSEKEVVIMHYIRDKTSIQFALSSSWGPRKTPLRMRCHYHKTMGHDTPSILQTCSIFKCPVLRRKRLNPNIEGINYQNSIWELAGVLFASASSHPSHDRIAESGSLITAVGSESRASMIRASSSLITIKTTKSRDNIYRSMFIS